MFSQIKEEYNLYCSEDQFNNFISEYISNTSQIAISLTKHSFDDLYNGNPVPNLFDNDNARYYVLSIEGGNTYLQYHVPYAEGLEMITDENFDEVSKSHCEQLTDQFIRSKAFNAAIDYFKTK